MHKRISYILLLLLSYQILGFVGYFEYSRFKIKKEIKTRIKQGVPKSELVYFEFSKTKIKSLTWLKSNEFEYHGNLYDVVRSSKTKNAKIRLECVSDTQEKILFAKLGQSVSNNMGDEHHQTLVFNWFKILKVPFICSSQDIWNNEIVEFIPSKKIFFYQQFNSKLYKQNHTPPPQLA